MVMISEDESTKIIISKGLKTKVDKSPVRPALIIRYLNYILIIFYHANITNANININ